MNFLGSATDWIRHKIYPNRVPPLRDEDVIKKEQKAVELVKLTAMSLNAQTIRLRSELTELERLAKHQ